MAIDVAVSYEALGYIAVFVVACVIGLIAAVIFFIVELTRRPRLGWGSIILWSTVLFLVFACTGTCLAAVAVYDFPIAAGVLLMFFVTALVLWLLIYGTSNDFRSAPAKLEKDRLVSCLTVPKRRPLVFSLCVVLAAVWALTSVWVYGLCLSAYPVALTTWISRMSQLNMTEERCNYDGGRPCHVYFTLSAAHNVFVANYHYRLYTSTVEAVPQVRWYYDDTNSSETAENGRVLVYPDIPYGSQSQYRGVAWAYFGPLAPNRTVAVRVSSDGLVWSRFYRLRTLPDEDRDLRICAGGDSGDRNRTALFRVAVSNEPHVALHGGDIAYGNGFINCLHTWDGWFFRWEAYMVTPMGFYVPMIMAIGNHEAGGFSRSRGDVPYYLKYFVQEPGVTDQESSRHSYHVHQLTSKTTVIVLDTNVIVPHQQQVEWLTSQLTAAPGPSKWALYHAPLYSVGLPLSYVHSVTGRQYWGPVFETLGLQLGIENHAHSAKRTNPIINMEGVASGPIYVGEGCWGVDDAPPRTDLEPGLFAYAGQALHVILGERNADNTGWDMRLVNYAGVVLHRFNVAG